MPFNPSRVTYSLAVEVDGTPLEGNVLACGDEAEDLAAEHEVARRLMAGDVWAWACVTVEAHYPGLPFVGRSILGGCNYAGESDFTQEGGYYTDMKAEALSDLQEQAERVVAALAE
jgi:hypothetical protein